MLGKLRAVRQSMVWFVREIADAPDAIRSRRRRTDAGHGNESDRGLQRHCDRANRVRQICVDRTNPYDFAIPPASASPKVGDTVHENGCKRIISYYNRKIKL